MSAPSIEQLWQEIAAQIPTGGEMLPDLRTVFFAGANSIIGEIRNLADAGEEVGSAVLEAWSEELLTFWSTPAPYLRRD